MQMLALCSSHSFSIAIRTFIRKDSPLILGMTAQINNCVISNPSGILKVVSVRDISGTDHDPRAGRKD